MAGDLVAPIMQPDWPAPAHVRALFTTRGRSAADGASEAPYAFFNLGDHVGDAPAAVASNRQRLQHALAGARPVFMKQLHGVGVLPLQADTADGLEADAAISTQPGLACTVMVADCLPVLLTDTAGRAVAAAHAGWRGLAGGVLEQSVTSFQALAPTNPARTAIDNEAVELLAWLGPCIGPEEFEVGAEVRDAFLASDASAAACFTALPGGRKYLADLPALARRRLVQRGVVRIYGNDGSDAWCTVRQAADFFSYRRDQVREGGTGRMAACIWLA